MVIVMQILLIAFIFPPYCYGAPVEVDPPYGTAPTIDGNYSNDEWDDANFTNSELAHLQDLDIELGVKLCDSNLYILIRIELGGRPNEEFVAIIIANSTSYFVDAKIIQFHNLTNDEFNYTDYYVENDDFVQDDEMDGNGAAKRDSTEINTVNYEFSIPIEDTGDSNDVYLECGKSYLFNISYGDSPSYPGGIIKSNLFSINIQEQSSPQIDITELTLFILSIISFSCIGALLAVYSYKIIILKKKIGRLIG